MTHLRQMYHGAGVSVEQYGAKNVNKKNNQA